MADPGLHRYPWYYGEFSRLEAETHLKDVGENEGCFLVRKSSRLNAWTVSVLNWNGVECTVGHYLVSTTPDNRVYFEEDITFTSLGSLIEYYQKNPGRLSFKMRDPCPKDSQPTTDDYGYTIYDVPLELPEHERFIRRTMIYNGSVGENWKGFLASAPTVQLIGKYPHNGEDAKYALSHEANIMRKLAHENITRLFGVITQPSFILLTYDAGDTSLIRFLLDGASTEISTVQQLGIAKQIASALDHCRRMKCVHRNVKAKSVVIDRSNMTCKLASLKHCRFQDDHGYFHATREEDKNPTKMGSRVRWMSLEAAKEGRFSTASDVWSYAIFLLEIFTQGALPYAGFLTYKVLNKVEAGYRCSKPQSCPAEVYVMMTKCWDAEEDLRPTFKDIRKFLHTFLNDNRELLSKLAPAPQTDWNHYASWRPPGLTQSIKQPRTGPRSPVAHAIPPDSKEKSQKLQGVDELSGNDARLST